MRKQPRSAASIIASLCTAGAILTTAFGPLATASANDDRTDSTTYTESRADYWEARAAYEARKAATQARKAAGIKDSTADPAALDTGSVGGPGEAAEPVSKAAAAADGVPSNSQLAALRMCESTDNYFINSGNGYYGAYQFSPLTWWWLGYGGYPHNASPAVQDEAARYLYSIFGWSPWPGCSSSLGFR